MHARVSFVLFMMHVNPKTSSQIMRDRMTTLLRLFPEHDMKFFFDKFHRVHIVVPDSNQGGNQKGSSSAGGDLAGSRVGEREVITNPRGGLPKWLGALVSTMTESEMHQLHGADVKVYSQADAYELLIHGTEWRVGDEMTR